jgi:hypothetical protein
MRTGVCEGSPEQEAVPGFWAYAEGRDGTSVGPVVRNVKIY